MALMRLNGLAVTNVMVTGIIIHVCPVRDKLKWMCVWSCKLLGCAMHAGLKSKVIENNLCFKQMKLQKKYLFIR